MLLGAFPNGLSYSTTSNNRRCAIIQKTCAELRVKDFPLWLLVNRAISNESLIEPVVLLPQLSYGQRENVILEKVQAKYEERERAVGMLSIFDNAPDNLSGYMRKKLQKMYLPTWLSDYREEQSARTHNRIAGSLRSRLLHTIERFTYDEVHRRMGDYASQSKACDEGLAMPVEERHALVAKDDEYELPYFWYAKNEYLTEVRDSFALRAKFLKAWKGYLLQAHATLKGDLGPTENSVEKAFGLYHMGFKAYEEFSRTRPNPESCNDEGIVGYGSDEIMNLQEGSWWWADVQLKP